jgi:glyoxylase-like metal-dependent hydrolase (beta-lactamase superfamily II)
MSIDIRVFTLGIAVTNAYLVADKATDEALVIDPVDDADLIQRTADELGWTIRLILATHAHFDHVLASQRLKELTGAPFHIHEEAARQLKTLPQQGVMFTGKPFPEAAVPDRLLTSDSEIIELGAIRLETLYTPGHAPGHLAFFMRDQRIVFSGDALFAGSIGRTDLPGGNYEVLMSSILDQLLPLGDDVTVLSGHGGATTIGDERRSNPFLN